MGNQEFFYEVAVDGNKDWFYSLFPDGLSDDEKEELFITLQGSPEMALCEFGRYWDSQVGTAEGPDKFLTSASLYEVVRNYDGTETRTELATI